MRLREIHRNSQPQAHPFSKASAGASAIKGIKDAWLLVHWNAGVGIFDANAHLAVYTLGCNRNNATSFGVLVRVSQWVAQNLGYANCKPFASAAACQVVNTGAATVRSTPRAQTKAAMYPENDRTAAPNRRASGASGELDPSSRQLNLRAISFVPPHWFAML